MMVMTILEGHVSTENWSTLEQAYQEASKQKESGLVQSYLNHSIKEPEVWRIITLWRNREALDEMRKSTETPRGVLIFHGANSEPGLSVFEVAQQIFPE
jgi:quinol monooxygenase YgiN